MNRVLIVGAGGFIGRRLMSLLHAAGVACRTAGTRPGGPDHVIFDPDRVAEWSRVLSIARPDVVFHLAGAGGNADAATIFRVNCTWAANLLSAAEAWRARVILIGSAAEYGVVQPGRPPLDEDTPVHPRSLYGISKYAQTQLGLAAIERGADVIVARLFNVVGAGMPTTLFLSTMARELAAQWETPPESRRLVVGNPGVARDIIPLQAAAEGLIALAREPGARGLVCLCSGQPVTNRRLLDDLFAVAQCRAEIVVDAARRNQFDPPVVCGSQARFTALTGLTLPPVSREDVHETWVGVLAETGLKPN